MTGDLVSRVWTRPGKLATVIFLTNYPSRKAVLTLTYDAANDEGGTADETNVSPHSVHGLVCRLHLELHITVGGTLPQVA